MKNLFLAGPAKEYQKSFENYVQAYKSVNDNHYLDIYEKGLENFDEYLNGLRNNSKGIDVEKGWVATSTFWLIDNNEVVGVVRIRHQEIGTAGHIGYDISPNCRNKGYGNQILKLAVVEAEKIGIKEAVLTCSVDNIASKKIIEKNNGKLLGTVFDEEDNENMYKFSITTTTNKL
ncbi:GNAT family N-acetyltransferase [Lacrimispora sp. AGF001]|uniref:GNAT family N-acetyltransferase n=1 Tax=Lacrimispora sp. AGF001 TaxID=3401631 RepID=UPI003B437ED0